MYRRSAVGDVGDAVAGANSPGEPLDFLAAHYSPRALKRRRRSVLGWSRACDETPRLSLWVMGLQESLHELPRVVELAAQVKVHEVYLQRLVTSERGIARSDNSLYGSGPNTLDPIQEAHRLAVELGIDLKGSGNTTGAASVRPTSEHAPWRGCRRPWSLMYVSANGNVLPCCISVFTDTPYEDLVLGNLFESSVAEVWNGERYRAWRGAMLSGEPPEACKGCGVSWSL